jgi:hypothetical protein
MFKNKFNLGSLIVGIIIGTILMLAIPTYAAIQEYILTSTASKITVDGTEIKNDTLPMMSYQGYNYIPAVIFRDICEKIGVGFEWNNEAKEIQIITGDTTKSAITTVSTTGAISTKENITNNIPNEYDKNGIRCIMYEGKEYANFTRLVGHILKLNQNSFLTYNYITKEVFLVSNSNELRNIPFINE